VLVAAPWFVALSAAGHGAVLEEVLVRQNFQRFTNPWDHVAPFWYYAPYVFIDMAPYAFFAAVAARLPRRDEAERRLARLSWVWIAAIVLFFSLSKSKRDPYIVPIAPAIAVLASEVAVAFAGGRLTAGRRRAVVAIAGVLAAGLVAGGLFVAARLVPRYPDMAAAGWALAATSVLGGAALAVAARRRAALPIAIPAVAAALYLVVASAVLPALDAVKSARPASDAIAALAGDARVVSYNFWIWRAEYRYYLDRPIENLTGPDALRAAWAGPDRLVLLVDAGTIASARQVLGDRSPALTRKIGSQTLYVFTNR
jgi:4-amino-4-deoxy-L-arabinose transferase-like glycosyltransferase